MKKWLCIVALVLVLLPGCGVLMNAEYSTLLDRTAALSADTAAKAEAGTLTPAEMRQALMLQAQTWQLFRNARDGKKE